ncbi:uncharacterized protein si:ch211-13c6.2 isoform X2 [Clinocottus analis]
MKLNEPIIGLNYLEELPCNDSQAGIKYICKLCHQKANLSEMVHHVIGRKHRQKYVELKRPDLVTWNQQSIITHGGKIVRARAEIIERQDGRGTPVLMPKMGIMDKFNFSKVPPMQNQKRDQNLLQQLTQRDVSSDLKDYRDECSHPGRYLPGRPDTAPLRPEDSYMLDRDRPMYQQKDTLRYGRMEEELQRPDHRESHIYRREFRDPDYRTEYEEEYVEDPQRRADPEPDYDSRFGSRQEMPRGQAQRGEYYPDEATTSRKPYRERDPLKVFYTEEVQRRGQGCSEYSPSQPGHLEGDKEQYSLNWESDRRESMNGAGRQGSSEPEAKRRNFPTSMVNDQTPDGHLVNFVRDYRREMREAYQEEAVANPGQSRTGTPTTQRQVEATRAISDIPEPFRRFLKGAANEGNVKRKRKSRFSDATAEEAATTKELFSDDFGPPNPKFGGRPRPVHETQHPNLIVESQGMRRTESYQGEGSESTGVFEMLNNIEIENAEEADFLKNKLCNLLKEFKSKKSEKAAQNSQGRVAVPKNYNSFNPDPEQSPRPQYDTTHREDSDLRRPEDYFKNDQRGRGWQQQEHVPDEQRNEYHHSVCGEPGHSNRRRYEEVFGWPRTRHASHPDESACNVGRFEEPMHPLDYTRAPEGFMDSQSSAPPLRMEQRNRMDRGFRYSNNLDKITSTLLELVARK